MEVYGSEREGEKEKENKWKKHYSYCAERGRCFVGMGFARIRVLDCFVKMRALMSFCKVLREKYCFPCPICTIGMHLTRALN